MPVDFLCRFYSIPSIFQEIYYTLCPRSVDPFYILIYNMGHPSWIPQAKNTPGGLKLLARNSIFYPHKIQLNISDFNHDQPPPPEVFTVKNFKDIKYKRNFRY